MSYSAAVASLSLHSAAAWSPTSVLACHFSGQLGNVQNQTTTGLDQAIFCAAVPALCKSFESKLISRIHRPGTRWRVVKTRRGGPAHGQADGKSSDQIRLVHTPESAQEDGQGRLWPLRRVAIALSQLSCALRAVQRTAHQWQGRFASARGLLCLPATQRLRDDARSELDRAASESQRGQPPGTPWEPLWRWTLFAGSAVATLVVMGGLLTSVPQPGPALALTEEQIVFLEAWRTVDRAYIDKSFNGQNWFRYRQDALKSTPMNDRQQTYDAIRQMLGSLGDPFTRFLEPDKLRTLRAGTNGAVTGVGLEVGFGSEQHPGDLVVVAPVSGGPADRAGVAPGDILRSINGISTQGMGLYDAAQRLQGPPQTVVDLTLERSTNGSAAQSVSLTMTREKIDLNPVTFRACTSPHGGPTVGYIRLATFNQNSAGAVREAIKTLRGEGAGAFVLDIRNNGGGLFPAGIEIAKMWLKEGVVVYITDSMGVRDIYDTEGGAAIATEEPLAVLVNKGTASASEILAGALKDNKRAVILGEPTFGKGKIQSVFELSDGSGLAVTIARYETPGRIDIDKVGITPTKPLPASIPMDGEGFCACLADPATAPSLEPSFLFGPR